MERRLKIVNLKDRKTDFSYWQSQSETARLQVVELLRQQYINFKKDVYPRPQRVCRIIN